jgi:hypothetical protein
MVRNLRVEGNRIVDGDGATVVLRGVGLGGWMNMENFITGYPATESAMREAVEAVLGAERADAFFARLLDAFFGAADAEFLASLGVNCVRLPINQRHFENDWAPFEWVSEGFERLADAVRVLGAHGIHSVIDLHAVPGGQNQHWHSDNPTHVAAFWRHPHFQERATALWVELASRFAGEPWVAGYNLLNEPADPTGEVVGPWTERTVAAIRDVDPDHILFLDGNRYSTDFSAFGSRLPTPSTPATTTRPRGWPSAAATRARRRRSRRSSSSARSTNARRARRSGSASSGRSTPASRSSTSSATSC